MLEIERKFLVKNESFKAMALKKTYFAQGYLHKTKLKTIRVRVASDKAWLTLKGPSLQQGLARYEFETEIPLEDGKYLLTLCEDGIIEKERYYVPCGKHVYEVDEFLGRNKGLIVAEVELKAIDEDFDKPDFIGKEVTGEVKYYNAQLSLYPFDTWTEVYNE